MKDEIGIIDFLVREKLLVGTLLALIILVIVNIYNDIFKKYIEVNTNDAITLMDEDNLTILDVREEKERKSGFIDRDINIPMSQVKAKLDELNSSKNILVYCKSGMRSGQIASLLCNNSFQNVYILKGGFNAWQKADLPIQN
tara:strand:- start:17 stop:442 length:426 start_codon:yes stop_codon:yes gene_type:complete